MALSACGDGPQPRVQDGRGPVFPLRGSLRDDPAVPRAALRALAAKRGEKAPRLDRRGDVFALWAGRVARRDVVVLNQDETFVVVARTGGGRWRIAASTSVEHGTADSPAIRAGGYMLLPRHAGTRFAPASIDRTGRRPAATVVSDGLLATADAGRAELPGGIVLPPAAGGVAVEISNVYEVPVRRDVDARASAAMARIVRGGLVDKLLGAIDAATERRTPGNGATLEILAAGRLPRLGTAVLVAQRDYSGPDLAGRATIAVSSRDDARRLGAGTAKASSVDGPLLAADYYRDSRLFVVAGTRAVRRLELRVGRRTLRLRGPVAALTPSWRRVGHTTPDVVTLGRTASGDAVSALAPPAP